MVMVDFRRDPHELKTEETIIPNRRGRRTTTGGGIVHIALSWSQWRQGGRWRSFTKGGRWLHRVKDRLVLTGLTTRRRQDVVALEIGTRIDPQSRSETELLVQFFHLWSCVFLRYFQPTSLLLTTKVRVRLCLCTGCLRFGSRNKTVSPTHGPSLSVRSDPTSERDTAVEVLEPWFPRSF